MSVLFLLCFVVEGLNRCLILKHTNSVEGQEEGNGEILLVDYVRERAKEKGRGLLLLSNLVTFTQDEVCKLIEDWGDLEDWDDDPWFEFDEEEVTERFALVM